MKAVVRPLIDVEKRLLRKAMARQRRFLIRLAPLVAVIVGVVPFGGLWGLTILATRADKTSLSWRTAGLIWLAIGIPIALWSYFSDLKPHVARYEGALGSALKRNQAVVVRIQASAVVEIEAVKNKNKNPVYAFQISGETIAFVIMPKSHLPAKFPTADFSLVDLVAENGRFAMSLVESEGSKLSPVRRISASGGAQLTIPGHLETVQGKLSGLESLLGR